MIWTAEDLSAALSVQVNLNICGGEIQFNSNSVKQGDLFIALQGNQDGHIYAVDALKRGANAVIISKKIDNLPEDKVILVEDTARALYKMAEYKRAKSKAKFIGITGSVGKTSTKDMTNTVLQAFGKVFASRGNFNNYLGVQINLASMSDDAEYAVFEMGMNKAGEIRSLGEIIRPDIALITSVSEAHLEFFDSVQGIADAKSEIFENLAKEGVAIIPLDNKYYGRILLNLEKLAIKNIHDFGRHEKAESQFKLYKNLGQQVLLVYQVDSDNIEITLPLIPIHYARNFSAVLLMAKLLKLDVHKAALELKKFELIEGRGQIKNVEKDGKQFQLICDYYNASPESLKASLEYLKELDHPKKVVVIGDMLELGQSAIQLHSDLVQRIIDSGADKVLLVGPNSNYIYSLLPGNMNKAHFDNVDLLIDKLHELIESNELILIKGSRGMKLDKIVQYFTVI
jgi:UDP-N-acetylmuramoyl-tripeptide--D-alanyl-D-alanine ligase